MWICIYSLKNNNEIHPSTTTTQVRKLPCASGCLSLFASLFLYFYHLCLFWTFTSMKSLYIDKLSWDFFLLEWILRFMLIVVALLLPPLYSLLPFKSSTTYLFIPLSKGPWVIPSFYDFVLQKGIMSPWIFFYMSLDRHVQEFL